MFCVKCGFKITDEDAKFCPKCGSPTQSDVSAKETIREQPEKPKKKERSKKNTGVGIGIGIIVAITILILVTNADDFSYSGTEQTTSEIEDNTSIVEPLDAKIDTPIVEPLDAKIDAPVIESLQIMGFDATDGNHLQYHDGFTSGNIETGANLDNGLKTTEYIAVYLSNQGESIITLSEIRLSGEVYTYVDLGGKHLPDWKSGFGTSGLSEYTLVEQGFSSNGEIDLTLDSSVPEIKPRQEITVILKLGRDVDIGRDMQFKMTTTSGAVFVGTIESGLLRK